MKLKRVAATVPAIDNWQGRVPNGIRTRRHRDKEAPATNPNELPRYAFRLYAADTDNSAMAHANLLALCKAHLPGRYSIELVDVFKEPHRALSDGIRLTPTVVRVTPAPVLTVVGTLKQTHRVLVALGIPAYTTEP